ncbi:hypothetical protein ACP70R_007631 [Stipagrostis hirtigluma subsp. patula]
MAAEAAADAVAGSSDGEAPAPATMVKMVELPVEYLKWVLAQRKEHYRVPTLADYSPEQVEEEEEAICKVIASLQAVHDEFFEFKAFVRDALEMDGCVMVPEDKLIPDFRQLQGRIDREWAEAKQELDVAVYDDYPGTEEDDDDDAEVAVLLWSDSETTTVPPLGPHLYTLSTYLSFIYRYVSHVAG